ncbi:MAG TPA: hypothetical protein PKE45_13985, partial [Caldilineaceae bacterium]|nr:hypothetical protein [Caldilineaceae bacterium]
PKQVGGRASQGVAGGRGNNGAGGLGPTPEPAAGRYGPNRRSALNAAQSSLAATGGPEKLPLPTPLERQADLLRLLC